MDIRIKIIQFLIHLNENLFFYPKLKAFYQKHTLAENNPLVIFDVGANKGQSIDFFSSIYKNALIYAFEPNPNLFNKLKIKYQNRKNIQIYNLGVSNINGQLELQETVTDETSTFEKLNYSSEYLAMKANILGVKKEEIIKNSYLVDVIKLSDFIKSNGISKIDILKIDTEGHELKCLQGLFSESSVPVGMIQLESHNDNMYLNEEAKDEIPKLIAANGLSKMTVIKHGFGNFNECIFEK